MNAAKTYMASNLRKENICSNIASLKQAITKWKHAQLMFLCLYIRHNWALGLAFTSTYMGHGKII